jgi:hypothetical protein
MADQKPPEQTPETKTDKPKTIKTEVLCDQLVHNGEIYGKGATVTDTDAALRQAIESEDLKKL